MDSNNANKICQWYCCSCGQSYGSIIYKCDKDGDERYGKNDSERKAEDVLLRKLKHYSNILYHSSSLLSPDQSCLVSPTFATGNPQTGYFDMIRAKDPTHSGHQHVSEVHSPHVSLPYGYVDYNDRISLSIPTRFTCHRCSHMMCPYCLKIRLKDLSE